VWLLDSTSSFHATPKEWFSSYIEKDGGLAHLGDDSSYHIIGVGDIKFKIWVISSSRCMMDRRFYSRV
jgi:hypothetical protein